MHPIKHFITISKHRRIVRHYCFKLGLYYQGIVHDLSKYSLPEFIPGALYFQGNRSPNDKERELFGYSKAWMHHKGRNKHHFEYWNELSLTTKEYVPVSLPIRYLKEMMCDRIAACRIYLGDKYTDASTYEYFIHHYPTTTKMTQESMDLLELWLKMLKEKGEKETFTYIKKNYPN